MFNFAKRKLKQPTTVEQGHTMQYTICTLREKEIKLTLEERLTTILVYNLCIFEHALS